MTKIKKESLFILLIILFALILCYVLGNQNIYESFGGRGGGRGGGSGGEGGVGKVHRGVVIVWMRRWYHVFVLEAHVG